MGRLHSWSELSNLLEKTRDVRELINLLSAMVALAHPGEMLDLHLAPGKLASTKFDINMLDPELPSDNDDRMDLPGKLDETSRKWIIRALNRFDGNLSAAAKALGVTRFGLRKMMKRLGIHHKKDSN